MVEMFLEYQGGLRCSCTHNPSSVSITTDAPVDNMGRGESFSPTDLLATSLGACILTTMGIVAQRNNWDIAGTTLVVQKEMVADPLRRVGKLSVSIRLNNEFDQKTIDILLNTANTCPVKISLSESVEIQLNLRNGSSTT